MDPFLSLSQIKSLLAERGLKPDKKLGQNFLIDRHIFGKIIEAAELSGKDHIIEIGTGLANLTRYLAQKAGQVISFEIDKGLLALCSQTTKAFDNIKIIPKNIISIPLTEVFELFSSPGIWHLAPGTYKVIANLPYQITSPLIEKFLLTEKPPEQMVLLIQKDVAERIIAKPSEINRLAVLVQYFANVKKVADVSPNSFWPRPKVTSSIIVIKPKTEVYQIPIAEHEKFLELVKLGFSQKRKKLSSLLAQEYGKKEEIESLLVEQKISSQARAQELSVDDWRSLYLKIF